MYMTSPSCKPRVLSHQPMQKYGQYIASIMITHLSPFLGLGGWCPSAGASIVLVNRCAVVVHVGVELHIPGQRCL